MRIFPPLLLFCFLPLGCSGSEPSTTSEVSLVEVTAWQEAETSRDPFWELDGGSEVTSCGPTSVQVEGEAVEVNTTTCNYVTLVQPSLEAIAEGDTLRVSAWWQTLASEEASLGHIAVFIDDMRLLEMEIPIPAEADAEDVEMRSSRAFPAGTPVYFHVHNHGFNSWTLGSVTLEQRETP